MTTTIEFSADAYAAIVTHARERAPEEVCGVLGGERVGAVGGGETEDTEDTEDASEATPDSVARTRVHSVDRAANVAPSPRRTYLIDPEEQLRIMEEIEERGREVVGFYHSHPTGPPKPSPTDESRATWAGYSYAICLPDVPFVGSWRWSGEEFTPETVSLR